MKNYILLFLLIIPIISFSQNFTKKEIKRFDKVLKRSNSAIRTFDKNSLVSVEKLSNGTVEGEIENALFMAGFEVVSNDVAKSSVNISNPLNVENKNIEISSKTEYKSVYVITVNGNFYQGAIIGRCQSALLSFSARIVDLANGGKLVGTFKFSGNALTYVACTEDVANAFAYKLLQLSDN